MPKESLSQFFQAHAIGLRFYSTQSQGPQNTQDGGNPDIPL